MEHFRQITTGETARMANRQIGKLMDALEKEFEVDPKMKSLIMKHLHWLAFDVEQAYKAGAETTSMENRNGQRRMDRQHK